MSNMYYEEMFSYKHLEIFRNCWFLGMTELVELLLCISFYYTFHMHSNSEVVLKEFYYKV